MQGQKYQVLFNTSSLSPMKIEKVYNYLNDLEVGENTFRIGKYHYEFGHEVLVSDELSKKIRGDNEISDLSIMNNPIPVFNVVFFHTFLPAPIFEEFRPYTNIGGGAGIAPIANHHDVKIIKQAYEDGLNIKPWVYHARKNTKELKELFGSNIWKRLCQYPKDTHPKLFNYIRIGAKHIKVNSLLLDYVDKFGVDKLIRFQTSDSDMKGVVAYTQNSIRSGKFVDYITIRDCILSCSRLNIEFNEDWGMGKIREIHDESIRHFTFAQMGVDRSDKFPIPPELKEIENLDNRGVEYNILEGAEDYFNEGKDMKHCLATHYAKSAKSGKYLAISMRKGEVRATAGYVNNYNTGYRLEQLKSYHNNVTNIPKEMKDFAKDIEGLLTEIKSENVEDKVDEPKKSSNEELVIFSSIIFFITLPLIIYGLVSLS